MTESIKAALQAEVERLVEELAPLKSAFEAKSAELWKVRSALSALDGSEEKPWQGYLPKTSRPGSCADYIRKMSADGGELTSQAVAAATGCSVVAASIQLNRFARSGFMVRIGRNRFRRAEAAQ